jgi:Flp pilus assembly protein TadD/TolB-like protein
LGGPNLCRIHELFISTNQEAPPIEAFLTMELLQGVTLAEEIKQKGALDWPDAQKIAIEICSALEAVHAAGIIHRDLKARNIMLVPRNGVVRAVLMDFGLAREVARDAHSETALTVPGAVVGPSSMAPEQFSKAALTPATDIYALGVVLYQMLTGQLPFPEDDPVRAAILRSSLPKPPSLVRQSVPRRFDRVVTQCLQFDQQNRYQSAAEVARSLRAESRWPDLRVPHGSGRIAAWLSPLLLLSGLLVLPAFRERLQGIVLSSHQKHIAVLPFDVDNSTPEELAFADGLMDSLCGQLANLNGSSQSFWVVPAVEVRKSRIDDPTLALRKVGATIALKGRVRRREQMVHITLHVIDSEQNREIGSVEVEKSAEQLADLEDEIVKRVSRLINVKEPLNLPQSGRTARAAYEEYLTAAGFLDRYDQPGNLDKAIALLNQVIAEDDHSSLAHTTMAEAYRLKYQLDQNPSWLSRAEQAVAKGAELGQDLPITHITNARIQQAKGNYNLALQEFERSLRLDPSEPEALMGLANAYKQMHRLGEAETTLKKAIALRSDYWDGYDQLGILYDDQDRFKEAIAQYDHALQLTPDNAQVYSNLGSAYIDGADPHDWPLAENALKRSIEINPSYAAYANLGTLYGAQGHYSQAAATTERALQLDNHDYRVWGNLAVAYEWLNDTENAALARKGMLKSLNEHLEKETKDAVGRSSLAVILAHDGDRAQAIRSAQTAFALAPEDPQVLSNIADAYELLGSRKQAIAYLSMAMKRGLSESDVRTDPYLKGLAKDPRIRSRN